MPRNEESVQNITKHAQGRSFPLHTSVFPSSVSRHARIESDRRIEGKVNGRTGRPTCRHTNGNDMRPEWNVETGVGERKLCVRPTRVIAKGQGLVDAQYDYREGSTDKAVARRDASQLRDSLRPRSPPPSWDITTSAPKSRDKSVEKQTMASLAATKRATERIFNNSARNNNNNNKTYIHPEERSAMILEKRRARAKLERELGKDGIAAKEKEERIRQERIERLKANKRDKSNWIKVTKHTGNWEYSAIERSEVWSCCMSSVHGSPGCSVAYKNPDSWNLTTAP